MKSMRNLRGLICVVALTLALPAFGQDKYPSRPVTIVVGFGAGGSSDLFARFVADYARKTRGAALVVENRVGLSGGLAMERVAKSAPDGYTVAVGSISSLWLLPQSQPMNYDPLKDLDYLGKMFTQPLPLYVRADSPFKTFDDVLAYARANPGKFRWGTSGSRGVGEIITDSGFRHAHVDTISVPYKAGVEANVALLSEMVRTKEYAELCDKIFLLPSYADGAAFKRMVARGYAEFGKALASLPAK